MHSTGMSSPYDDGSRSDWMPVSYGVFRRAMRSINDRLWSVEQSIRNEGSAIVATQADIDALTASLSDLDAKLTAEDSSLQSAVTGIQAWISAQPASVDVSGLQAAVSTLTAANDDLANSVASAAALVPPATS